MKERLLRCCSAGEAYWSYHCRNVRHQVNRLLQKVFEGRGSIDRVAYWALFDDILRSPIGAMPARMSSSAAHANRALKPSFHHFSLHKRTYICCDSRNKIFRRWDYLWTNRSYRLKRMGWAIIYIDKPNTFFCVPLLLCLSQYKHIWEENMCYDFRLPVLPRRREP
jgi:hypothetical protein